VKDGRSNGISQSRSFTQLNNTQREFAQ
jgi:hypothetical protein